MFKRRGCNNLCTRSQKPKPIHAKLKDFPTYAFMFNLLHLSLLTLLTIRTSLPTTLYLFQKLRLPRARNRHCSRTANRYCVSMIRVRLPSNSPITRHLDEFILNDRSGCEATDGTSPQGIVSCICAGRKSDCGTGIPVSDSSDVADNFNDGAVGRSYEFVERDGD